MRLEEVRKEIVIGIEASDRSEVFDSEEVLKELRQEIKQAKHGTNSSKHRCPMLR